MFRFWSSWSGLIQLLSVLFSPSVFCWYSSRVRRIIARRSDKTSLSRLPCAGAPVLTSSNKTILTSRKAFYILRQIYFLIAVYSSLFYISFSHAPIDFYYSMVYNICVWAISHAFSRSRSTVAAVLFKASSCLIFHQYRRL